MIRHDKILAIDDEQSVLDVYRDVLAEEGLALRTATGVQQAADALDEGDWAIVLLDQKLHGAHGGDDGLELLTEIERRSPGAKTIVVTGYASPKAIERAFNAGVYDYVEKTENFETLLRAKVRNASEMARQQWLARSSQTETDAQLERLWADVRVETDRNRKGRLLEDLLELLFRLVPGFVVTARRRGADEEFDLIVRNESTDPLWSKESALILIECKNWSSRVGPDELDRFVSKLERRYGRAKLGFFVAANGFTRGFASTLATGRQRDVLVVPLDATALQRLVDGPDREALLEQLYQQAIEAKS